MEYRPSSISSHVEDQFPKVYRDDGPDFVAFVKTYYEFLDESNERNFSSLGDVDSTVDSFLKYYKKKYLNSLPFVESSTKDIPFLVKNIADLYRSKGTQEALELMFKMFYKEEIETHYPASSILTLSDSKWAFSTYLEFKPVTSTNNFPIQKGDIIEGDTTKATAFIDEIVFYNINGVQLPVGYISNVYGKFSSDDSLRVTRAGINSFPGRLIYGSIAKPEVLDKDGTADNKVGDKLLLESSKYGVEGEAVVRAVSDIPTGTIEWELKNKGWGYDTSTIRNIDNRLETENIQMTSTQVMVVAGNQSGFGPVTNLKPGVVLTVEDDPNLIEAGSFFERTSVWSIPSAGSAANDYVVKGKAVVVAYEHPLLFISSYADNDPKYLNPLDVSNVAPYNNGAFAIRARADESITTDEWPDAVAYARIRVDVPGIETLDDIWISALSDFNDSASFEPESFSEKETVTFFTDIIGDFASTPLATVINASSVQLNGSSYEIVSLNNGTGGADTDYTISFFDSPNNEIGTIFSPDTDAGTLPQGGVGTGKMIDITGPGTAGNYNMSGQFYTDYRTPIAEALGSKTAEIGAIESITTTSGGSEYKNNVRTYIFNDSIRKFGYGPIRVRFDKSNFGIQIDDVIEQTIQVPNLAKNDAGQFTNLGETIDYVAKAKLISLDPETNEFIFQPLSFYSFDVNGPAVSFFGNTLTIKSISRVYADRNRLGENAVVEGKASFQAGQITDIDVIKSGFRYKTGEEVKLINNDSDNDDKYEKWVGTAKVTVSDSGVTEGKWKTTKSHLSDSNRYIHDNDYYQEYSYDISTILDTQVYEKTLKDVVHVAGTKFFGTPLISTVNDVTPSIDSNVVKFDVRKEFLQSEVNTLDENGANAGGELFEVGAGTETSSSTIVRAGQLTIGTAYLIKSVAGTTQPDWETIAGVGSGSGITFAPGVRFIAATDGSEMGSGSFVIPAALAVLVEENPVTYVEFNS